MAKPAKPPYEFPSVNLFDDSISDALLTHHLFSALCPREIDVFARVVHGVLVKNIAAELGISKRTVDFLRYRMKKKLRLRGIAEEAVLGYRVRVALATWVAARSFQRSCQLNQRVGGSAAKLIDNVHNSVE